MVLHNATIRELEWWFHVLYSWNGWSITVDCQYFTGASHIEWGAVLEWWKTKGFLEQLCSEQIIQLSRNTEILVIFMAILAFNDLVKDKCIQTNGQQHYSHRVYISSRGPIQQLTQIAIAIWRVTLMNNITLKTHHILGVLNGPVNQLSRLNA